MGRQVEFYMWGQDEREFIDFVKSTGEVIILPYTSPKADMPALAELPPASDEFMLWLFNRNVSSRLLTRFVQQQDYNVVDRDLSSVVEFSRTVLSEGVLVPGRLWAIFNYVTPDMQWAYKEPEFKKWYERLARWIRKNYSRDPDLGHGFYFGPEARELARTGKVKLRGY